MELKHGKTAGGNLYLILGMHHRILSINISPIKPFFEFEQYERNDLIIMERYLPPLSIEFVWYPADELIVRPIFEYCSLLLSRDVNKPFSRAINLPIFCRTTSKKGVPSKIDIVSKKTMIFIFIGEEVMSDDSWINYIKEIQADGNVHVMPVALDKTAFGINLGKKNFIRAYEFEQAYLNDYMFISIAHEIYRWTLNESFSEKVLGKDNALKIFLSHAKDGKIGIKLAKALKDFIDNSTMRNFFDATDIAPSYRFDEEIIGHIKESSLIAIHSDTYSSRYWCQMEILSAKEYNRPMIVVDCIEEFEDRRFPFAANVPGVHAGIDGEPTKMDLLRILKAVLLETVRFFYSKILLEQYKNVGWITSDSEICSRPPDISDIEKILFEDGSSIGRKCMKIVYPDPPVYLEELSFLSKLGIKLSTPLTVDPSLYHGKKIGISISETSEEELIDLGQSKDYLVRLSQDISRHLLAHDATLIYGGDLRENGFTEFLFSEAQALQARLQTEHVYIKNFIAWPVYKNDSNDIKKWKSKYRPIAMMKEIPPPSDVIDLIPSIKSFLVPSNPQNLFVWSRCLTDMRKKMIGGCDFRICAGGRHSGYKGRMPGILEEIIIAIEMKRPLYLLGGFGGITANVCNYIENNELPIELTEDWQIQNNPGYKDFLEFCSSRGMQYIVDYSSIVQNLKFENLKNGLSEEENHILFRTRFIDEALYYILKGLKQLCEDENPNYLKVT